MDNIPGIEFVYVTKDIIAADAERLSNRLNSALAITGTQKYHFYEPISKVVLHGSRTSVQDSGFPKQTFIVLPSLPDRNFVPISDLFVDDYVAVVFMSQWWIAKILDVDYNGVNVKLFSEKGPCLNYTWRPKTNDVFISISDVLVKINPPKPRTRSGRSFGITSDENNLISKEFELYVSLIST